MSDKRWASIYLSRLARLLLLMLVAAGVGKTPEAKAQTQNLMWQNMQTGDVTTWYVTDVAWMGNYDYLGHSIPLQWQVAANEDFNDDGETDFIWQNTQTGDVSYWLMKGTQRLSSDYVARNISLQWKIVGAADFNRDNNPDLIWQNIQTGDIVVWYMDSVTWTGNWDYLGRHIPLQWCISALADLNNDRNPDLVWQNTTTGDVTIWYMNGAVWNGGYAYLAHNVPPDWKNVGAGDFNGDSKLDLVWQNTQTGDVTVWYMNGVLWTGNWDYLGHNVPTQWRICGVRHGPLPISWWKAENNTLDSIDGNHGVISGGVGYGAGHRGKGFVVNGFDGVINLGDPANLQLTDSITIDVWINITDFPSPAQRWGNILFRGDDRDGIDPYFLAVDRDGMLVWQVAAAFNVTAEIDVPISLGVLHHVTATLNGETGDMRLYVDGQLQGQQFTSIRPARDLDPNLPGGVAIGNFSGVPQSVFNGPFNGTIDELKIYDKVVLP